MSLRNVGIVYRKELREALRDRRTLITTILVPLLMLPVLTVGFIGVASMVVGKAKEQKAKVMVLGAANAPDAVAQLRQSKKIEVLPEAADWKSQIGEKTIGAAVEFPPDFQSNLGQRPAGTVKIYIYEGELKSGLTAGAVEESLKDYRDTVVVERLAANHLPKELAKPFDMKQENVASAQRVFGAVLGGMIAYLLIFMCLNGGMHPAIDLTAGEKERGTMETILSSPVSRTHLVLGKFLLVLTASLTTAGLLILSLSGWLLAIRLFHLTDGLSDAGQPPLQVVMGPLAVLSVFIMAIPLAVLFSAGLITIALFAKSHKEAQSYIAPLMFLVVIPSVAAMLPGVDLTPKLAIIPLLNVSLLCKELVTGVYHWNYIALIFLSTCLYAAGVLFLAVKMFQRESVLFRS